MEKVQDKTLAPAEERWHKDYQSQIGQDRIVKNRSGIQVRPLYTPADWNGERYVEDLNYPGQFPFTRGIYPTMHRGRTWSQRQLVGLGTPQDYNERVRKMLANGANAISLLPCNSGFRGLDCDEVALPLLSVLLAHYSRRFEYYLDHIAISHRKKCGYR